MQYYTNKEELPYFIYNGISSAEFNLVVTKYDNLSSSENNFELISVAGRNGSYLSEKEVENINREVEFYIDCETVEEMNILSKKIKRWLQGDPGYKDLIFSDDLNTIHEAVCINKINIDEVIESFGECKLTFSCKPYTKTTFNSPITITENNSKIYSEYYSSEPIIKIAGNGDITISINNENLILKEIENEIIVDTQNMECYKKVNGIVTYQNDKMYSDFPILQEGTNEISWVGNVTRLEITPNWLEL